MADLWLIRALWDGSKSLCIAPFILVKSRGKKNNGSMKELKFIPRIDVCMDKQTLVVGSHTSRWHSKRGQSSFFIFNYGKAQCVHSFKILYLMKEEEFLNEITVRFGIPNQHAIFWISFSGKGMLGIPWNIQHCINIWDRKFQPKSFTLGEVLSNEK